MSKFATLVSLGCAKNLVDSETMVPQLMNLGYTMTPDPSEAGLILVNTCGFLESAVEEAIETILELSRHKASGSCELLVVSGCMVQRYGKKLPELLPEVDLFLGTSHVGQLEDTLRARANGGCAPLYLAPPRSLVTRHTPRVRSTPFYSAYLKIADGCSNRCTFCMIPRLRGPYRSRTVQDVLDEARALAEDGVKEVNLIAQDSTAFGHDRGDARALPTLLESLDEISGIAWVRLLYVYPDRVAPSLLRTMAQARKVVPYLDVPLQHCVPRVLSAMRRRAPISDARTVIETIRAHIPEVALRTSLMVGFPGETDQDFAALCRFVEQMAFEHVGVFAYSPEAGTKAARLSDQVPDEIKEDRRRTLLDLQRSISRHRLERLVGLEVPVLVEGPHPETELLLSGRLATQAPEVDGTVIITGGQGEVGQIMPARILAAHDYDVEAELLASGCSIPQSLRNP